MGVFNQLAYKDFRGNIGEVLKMCRDCVCVAGGWMDG